MMITMDSREYSKNIQMAEALETRGIEVKVEQLPVGDYFLIGERKNIVIERKTASDFAHSIVSRRMVDQCLMLVSVENAEPRILIEGSLALIKKFSNLNDFSVVGNLVSIMEDWGIQVVFVPSHYWTVLYFERLHRNLGKPKEKKLHPLRVKPKTTTLGEKIRCVVEGIPNVGPTLAHNLLSYFGTVRNLAQAEPEDLVAVPKIGGKKAKKIYEVLNALYV